MPNQYEESARLAKALALADILDAAHVSSNQAEALTIGERLDVAAAAGVKTPSDATWCATCGMLRAREECRILVDNPFSGLT